LWCCFLRLWSLSFFIVGVILGVSNLCTVPLCPRVCFLDCTLCASLLLRFGRVIVDFLIFPDVLLLRGCFLRGLFRLYLVDFTVILFGGSLLGPTLGFFGNRSILIIIIIIFGSTSSLLLGFWFLIDVLIL